MGPTEGFSDEEQQLVARVTRASQAPALKERGIAVEPLQEGDQEAFSALIRSRVGDVRAATGVEEERRGVDAPQLQWGEGMMACGYGGPADPEWTQPKRRRDDDHGSMGLLG